VNIDWVIPCRYAEVHDNLGTIVGAGIDTWWVAEFPAAIQVAVAVRLLATADELGEDHQHTVRNIVSGPSGEVLSDLVSSFAAAGPRVQTEWLNGIMVMMVIQFEAAGEGTYTFEHVVDESSRSIPLHVALDPPPGSGQSD
jgi:hypothetical protein